MVRFGVALSVVISAASVHSFQGQPTLVRPLNNSLIGRRRVLRVQRFVSASSSHPEYSDSSISDTLNSVTNAARDSISNAVSDDPDSDEVEIAMRKQMVENRMKTYKVALPLASSYVEAKSPLLSMGLHLRQISKGRSLDDGHLNLDTLEVEDFRKIEISNETESMDEQGLLRRIDGEFQGVVVSSVKKGSASWKAGVRAGDILQSTSATMGKKLWPKSTLEGVRSAIVSRKATSGSIEMEFQRLGDAVDNQFELTLTKPIGLQMKETEDGYVEVTGFTENAPTLVRYALKVGDRVLAVDSSLGGKMWPVSTVEGIVSAVTSRLPGQQITFRFERPLENFALETSNTAPVLSTREKAIVVESNVDEAELLKRCRGIIKRYTSGDTEKGNFVNKYSVPGLVADKVLDALASAGARVDAVTLSMIMGAYVSCRQADKAINAFEAIVGQKADGSRTSETAILQGANGKRVVSNIEALDLFTISALLKAHTMTGDLDSVTRVLAAVEGRSGEVIGGKEVAAWPGTGDDGVLTPDTRCYNIVMSAATKSRAPNGMELAMSIFDSMSEAKQSQNKKQKDLVSYNIILNALTDRGRYKEAVELFYKMKRSGIKPDKLSYTSLAKAITSDMDVDGDIMELFYDMKEQGVAPDVVIFNTAIEILCKQRRIAGAKKIVNTMEASGVPPDSMTYGFLMKGLIETGNASAALTLFETACSDRRTVVLTENTYLYTTAISAAASLGDHERALELLSRMNGIGVKPNMVTLTAIMGACLSSGKPDLAVDVFRRIANPDGYAVTQGLQALSEAGKTEEALQIIEEDRKQGKRLTGKQRMRAFFVMLKTELKRSDFEMARRVIDSLYKNGNIPSKAIYQVAFDTMKIFPKKRKGLEIATENDEFALDKFKFLLFLLDSIAGRNLPCEGPLYSAVLTQGFRIGGLPKRMASLLMSARTDAIKETKLLDETDSGEKVQMFQSWEELFLRYGEVKKRIASSGIPPLHVRTASRDVATVLRAEKNLSYRRTKMV